MLEIDGLLPTIEELVILDFPRAAESEINQRLMEKFASPGVKAWLVDRGNNADRPNSRPQSPKVDRHYRWQR